MFRAGTTEKLVQERTGHRSLEVLHQYEHSSDRQLLDVSNIMSGNSNTASSTLSRIQNETGKLVPRIMSGNISTASTTLSQVQHETIAMSVSNRSSYIYSLNICSV